MKSPHQTIGCAQVHWLLKTHPWHLPSHGASFCMCSGSYLDSGSATLFEMHLPTHPMSYCYRSSLVTKGLERALRTKTGCGGEASLCSKPPKANQEFLCPFCNISGSAEEERDIAPHQHFFHLLFSLTSLFLD